MTIFSMSLGGERTFQLWLKPALFFCLLMVLPFAHLSSKHLSAGFNKAAYFNAIASTSEGDIDAMLGKIAASEFPGKPGYEAALLMKKSGFLSHPAAKLKMFKQGRKQLEAAIATDPNDPEVRLLRIMIQENVPKIVGYRSDLTADAAFVSKWFSKLPSDVQQAARDYSKVSKVLKLTV